MVVVVVLLILPKLSLFSDAELSNDPTNNSSLFVSAIVVKAGIMENILKSAGTLLASEEVVLTTEVSGIVRSIHFEEGKRVQKGDLLISMDDSELLAHRDKALHQKALIEQTLERQRILLEKEAISRESFDKIQTDLLVIDSEIELLNTQIQKKQIKAPFDGIIGFRSISPGAYLQPGESIARLVKSNLLRIEFSVPERYQSANLEGRRVFFSVAGFEKIFEAQVYAIEPSVDANTRSLLLRALYNNEDLRLAPGMFADLSIIISRDEDVIQLPSEAIIPQMDGEQVYIYRDGKAELHTIKTGRRTERNVAVIDGVSVGDTVITSGILQLRNGMSVQIK